MFEAWGRIVQRRRWAVLAVGLIGVAIAAVWGTGVFRSLESSGGFSPPNSQSQRASDLMARSLGRDSADVVVLYRSASQTVDSPAYRDAVTRTLAVLPASKVVSDQTYWSTRSAQFVSTDRRATYAVIQLRGADDNARAKNFDAIKGRLAAPGLSTQTGGLIPTQKAVNKQVSGDIGKAEGFSMPILLILLAVIFGSLAAASLPLAIGGIAILGSFTVLRLLTLATNVSIYSINITTILGLGLAIDYGLFMVARFREELRSQATPGGSGGSPPRASTGAGGSGGSPPRASTVEDALARTVATAGRTVAVSGVTVAVALASLMLFPEMFLRSMGFGGVATVAVDVIAALTILPALLAVLGHRVNALRVRRSVRQPRLDEQSGAWYRIARSVMRRPVAYVAVIVVVLLALGTPFLKINWVGTDARVLPASAQARQVTEALNRDFPANVTSPIEAVVQLPGPAAAPAQQAVLASYVARLDHVTGVTAAKVTGAAGNVARVDLRYAPDPMSSQARGIVLRVREVPPPPGASVYVGGGTAELVDELASLGQTLPWMGLIVAIATFVLLFLAFGSVVLPVKAIVMNVLSLSAAFGAVVWIFQEGHLSGLLNFTATGSIDPTMPILMLAIIFGLSMDYEVFLLSRIRERYDITGDNTAAVASGLQRTGGIITSLALLLIVVVGAFSTSGIIFIKLFGVGTIIALLVDATIVRVLLVPATMRLLGRANWWAPRPLRRLYARYGMREASGAESAGPRVRQSATA
jgi:trehalose monomycolate/heme transporter